MKPKKGQLRLVICDFVATLVDHTGYRQPFAVNQAHTLLMQQGYECIDRKETDDGRVIEIWRLPDDQIHTRDVIDA